MHSSAPAGNSINDYISREEFSLHYTSIDGPVQLLSRQGSKYGKS